MSDRAKKNIAITDMMPQISNSWDELDLEQRDRPISKDIHVFIDLGSLHRKRG